MKRKIGQVLATTGLAAALFAVPAASFAAEVPSATFTKISIPVENRDAATLRIVDEEGSEMVSVRDTANIFGGKIFSDNAGSYLIMVNGGYYVIMTEGSTDVSINGEAYTIEQAPMKVGGVLVADLGELVWLFGGDFLVDAEGNAMLTMQALLDTESADIQWIDKSHLLVSIQGDEGTLVYKLNVNNREFALITEDTNVAEIAVSKNGSHAAYTNDLGEIILVDLNNMSSRKLTSDDTAKVELQFNKNGDKIYFLQGGNSETVSYISVADGKITKVIDDKVNYKSDLQITADEKKFLFNVTKGGVIKAAADGSDVESVDTANTEPQLNLYDATFGGKPLTLTKSTDNKTFGRFLADGTIIYVSSDVNSDESVSALKWIGADRTEKALTTDLDVIQAEVDAKGNILVLAYDKEGAKGIYSINAADGKATKWMSVADGVESFLMAADGRKAAVLVMGEDGEKVSLLAKRGNIDLTK